MTRNEIRERLFRLFENVIALQNDFSYNRYSSCTWRSAHAAAAKLYSHHQSGRKNTCTSWMTESD